MEFPNIQIGSAGLWKSPPEYLCMPEYRVVDKYELECYVTDTGKIFVEDEPFEPRKDCFLFVLPGQLRRAEFPYETRFLYFYLPQNESRELSELINAIPTWLPANEPLANLFDLLLDHKDCELRTVSLLIELLYRIKEQAPERAPRPTYVQEGQRETVAAVTFMKDHLTEKITIAELAQRAGYSQSHFTHLFRKYMNSSPYDYFIELRLNAATTQLITGASLADVAERFGFCSASHFCAIFRERRKMTPHQYIKVRKDMDF
jgi:transcriptional regulator, AraC family